MTHYYGFIDCEFTSGYAPRMQSVELINIGCVIFDELGNEVAAYESLVRPTKPSNQKLTRRIRELTRLSQAAIDQAPTFVSFAREFEAVLADFRTRFGHTIQWWSWGDYDQVALKQTLLVNNYQGVIAEFVTSIKDLQPQVVPSLFAKIDVKKHQLSLINCKRMFGLGETIRHQALSDARDLAQVFFAFRQQTPNWELVKSFVPVPQAKQATLTVTNVSWQQVDRMLGPQEYGLLKQLWHLVPPQAAVAIVWQPRQIKIGDGKPVRVSHLRGQWLWNERQLFFSLFERECKVPILTHTLAKTKQTSKLIEQLQQQLLKGGNQNGEEVTASMD